MSLAKDIFGPLLENIQGPLDRDEQGNGHWAVRDGRQVRFIEFAFQEAAQEDGLIAFTNAFNERFIATLETEIQGDVLPDKVQAEWEKMALAFSDDAPLPYCFSIAQRKRVAQVFLDQNRSDIDKRVRLVNYATNLLRSPTEDPNKIGRLFTVLEYIKQGLMTYSDLHIDPIDLQNLVAEGVKADLINMRNERETFLDEGMYFEVILAYLARTGLTPEELGLTDDEREQLRLFLVWDKYPPTIEKGLYSTIDWAEARKGR